MAEVFPLLIAYGLADGQKLEKGGSRNQMESRSQSDDVQPDFSEDRPKELAAAQGRLPKIVSFESLVRCGDEIWIENNGQVYRLRRTRQGKLILTK